MGTIEETFISNFHSLSGISIGERRKNLQLLLIRTQTLLKDSPGREIDLSSLQPQTHLEDVFKVDALLYFRKVPELVEILKSENPVLINKVLKASWFLRQAFENVTAEQLSTLIFPYISFSVKGKLLHKISLFLKDENKLDSYFRIIRTKYGLYLATKLLPSCSEGLIQDVFQNSRVKPTAKQLLRIVMKNPELSDGIFCSLLSYMPKYKINSVYKIVFLHLAKHHHASFLLLYDKFSPPLNLGWRSSDKFIQNNEKVVIEKADVYFKFLHKRQTILSLKEDFEKFYVKLFPNDIDNFPSCFNNLVRYIDKISDCERKCNLLENCFRNMYDTELLQNPHYINKRMMEFLPLDKIRTIRIKPNYLSDDNWLCYLKVNDSIPLLKRTISLTSDYKTRGDLILNLVETCRVNKDNAALEEVLKYVVERHRNDHVTVRKKVLVAIRHGFEMEKLADIHWKYINELIQIFKLNDEGFGLSEDFLVSYIHHRFLNGEPIEELVISYLKLENITLSCFRRSPDFEKFCLILIGNLLSRVPTISPKNMRRWFSTFFLTLINWNKRHPRDKIPLTNFEVILDTFRRDLEENSIVDLFNQSVVEYFLRTRPDDVDSTDGDLVKLCFSALHTFFDCGKITDWLLRFKPTLIASNCEITLKIILKHDATYFWKFSKNYSHLEIPQKLGKLLLETLKPDKYVNYSNRSDSLKKQCRSMIGLSYLMNTENYLQKGSNYYPSDSTANSSTDESKDFFTLQTYYAKSLRNIIPPSLSLQSVLNFCTGDYLKLIRRSLYSIIDNTNEDKVPLFLDQLATRAVSVRKHAFHLALRVLDRSSVDVIIKRLMEKEKNVSIRKFLFNGSFKRFVADPDDYLWELFKLSVLNVAIGDLEVAKSLKTEVYNICPPYLKEYVLTTYNYLEQFGDNRQKYEFLKSLPSETIKLLPKEFCVHKIKVLVNDISLHEYLNNFTIKFIVHSVSNEDIRESLNLLVPYFSQYLINTESRCALNEFMKSFCWQFFRQRCSSKEVLQMFANIWYDRIQPTKAFDQHILLQLCMLCVEVSAKNFSPFDVGRKLSQFCDTTTDKYGIATVTIVAKGVKSLVHNLYIESDHEEKRYELIEGLINNRRSSASLIISSLLLLPTTEISKNNSKHKEIVNFLSQVDDASVLAFLSKYLNQDLNKYGENCS